MTIVGARNGSFSGKGDWQMGDGNSGSYTVETVLRGDTLTSSYEYEGATGEDQKSHTMRMQFKDRTAFDVIGDTGVVGSGYCLDRQCFYRATLQGIVIEETLRFEAGELHKFGSKSGPGFQVVWQEVLFQQ